LITVEKSIINSNTALLIYKENPAQRYSGDGIHDGIGERPASAKPDTVNPIFLATV